MLSSIRKYINKHKRGVKVAAVIITLGTVYFILLQLTPFRLICPFQRLTGLACPGCGVTTMINRLFRLEFKEAVSENYAISLLFPVFAVIYSVKAIFDPKCLQNSGRLFNTIAWSAVVLLLMFGVIRNLDGFEFLLPSYMR